MNGIFHLSVQNGKPIELKFSRGVFYEFEKQQQRSFLSFFIESKRGVQRPSLDGTIRMDIQIDLAFLAQTKTVYTVEQLIEIADPNSLMEMMAFAISEYTDSRGLTKPKEKEGKQKKGNR